MGYVDALWALLKIFRHLKCTVFIVFNCIYQLLDLLRRCSIPIDKTGYRLQNEAITSHLLYTDDIKLYARNEWGINSLIHTTRISGNECHSDWRSRWMVTKRGRLSELRGSCYRRHHCRHWGWLQVPGNPTCKWEPRRATRSGTLLG